MADEPTAEQRRVLAMALAGGKMSELERLLNRPADSIRADVELVLADKYPDLDEPTAFEVERLETLTRALWVKAVSGDKPAVVTVADLIKRRSGLLEKARNRRCTPAKQLQSAMNYFLQEVSRGDIIPESTKETTA